MYELNIDVDRKYLRLQMDETLQQPESFSLWLQLILFDPLTNDSVEFNILFKKVSTYIGVLFFVLFVGYYTIAAILKTTFVIPTELGVAKSMTNRITRQFDRALCINIRSIGNPTFLDSGKRAIFLFE